MGLNWKHAALIVVDVQNDFCPGGALAVKDGDQVVPVINRLIEEALRNGALVIATRDWHPKETVHFNEWPEHCVQGSEGAKFHPDLELPMITQGVETTIVSKGMDPEEDAYSAFEGRLEDGTFLGEFLEKSKIKELIICGLATDYCVMDTALDAIVNGFSVTVVQNACRGVNKNEGDVDQSIQAMITYGVEMA